MIHSMCESIEIRFLCPPKTTFKALKSTSIWRHKAIKALRNIMSKCLSLSFKVFFFSSLVASCLYFTDFFLWYQQLSQQHDMETFLIKIIKIMSFIYPNNFSANGNYINLNLHAIIIYFQKQRALHFDE